MSLSWSANWLTENARRILWRSLAVALAQGSTAKASHRLRPLAIELDRWREVPDTRSLRRLPEPKPNYLAFWRRRRAPYCHLLRDMGPGLTRPGLRPSCHRRSAVGCATISS
jgi:hypothetical protein